VDPASTGVARIPVVPLSYANASEILRDVRGTAIPQAWQGGLPFRYHVGPGPVRARVAVTTDTSTAPFKTIWNTFGTVRGSEFPDELVIIGGHRDAWGPGAADNVSGTTSVLEISKRNMQTAYLLRDTTLEYHKSVTNGFEQGMKEFGGEIVGSDTFKNADPSIASQIAKMKGGDFDFIFLATFPPGGAAALKQIRAAGIDVPILSSNSFDGDFWKKAIPDISDFYYANYGSLEGDDPSDLVNELVQRFEEKTGKRYGTPRPPMAIRPSAVRWAYMYTCASSPSSTGSCQPMSAQAASGRGSVTIIVELSGSQLRRCPRSEAV
jgi:hypothetical protein